MSRRHGPLARIVTLLALGACLLSPLAALGQDTLAEIKKRGSINVFVEAQYRPYEFRDASGEIVGLDIDLARKMFEEGLGLKVVFTDLDLTGVLGSLLTRKADFVISGIPFSTLAAAEREAVLHATRAVLQPHGAFLVYQFSPMVLASLRRVFSQVRRGFQPLNMPPAQLFYCTP